MVAHPLMAFHIQAFVDALMEWANAPWAIAIDVPFIISGCIERMVIFDLHFRIEVPDGDLVLLWDDVIGRRLCWNSVERAITPME